MKEVLLKLLMAIVLVFAPIKATLLTVIILVGIDLVSGLWAAKARREKITSGGLKRTIVKIMVYELVVLLAFLVQQYLTGPYVPLVNILAGYIGITELKSVLENIEDISGMDIIKILINKVSQSDPER